MSINLVDIVSRPGFASQDKTRVGPKKFSL